MTTHYNARGSGDPPLHYLREWRTLKGLTLEELARRVGTTKGVISRYETGSRGMSLETQFAVARALGIWVGMLFVNPYDNDRKLSPRQQVQRVIEEIEGAEEKD